MHVLLHVFFSIKKLSYDVLANLFGLFIQSVKIQWTIDGFLLSDPYVAML